MEHARRGQVRWVILGEGGFMFMSRGRGGVSGGVCWRRLRENDVVRLLVDLETLVRDHAAREAEGDQRLRTCTGGRNGRGSMGL